MTREEVEKYVLSNTPKGWITLVSKLLEDLYACGWDGDIKQVKEKFGTLRFYTGFTTTDEMYDIIDIAELKSAEICIVCGDKATCVTEGWYTYRCDKHKNSQVVYGG